MASMTQETEAGGAAAVRDRGNWPNYSRDEEIFSSFLAHHEISQVVTGDDDEIDDDDQMLQPNQDNLNVTTVLCYKPHLTRIQTRHFYPETGSHTFIVEVPLDELVAWDSIKGADLADRVTKNTMRYHEIFAKVIDQALANLNVPMAGARDTIDILHQQRLAQQDQRQPVANNHNNNNPVNHYANPGNMQENADNQENNNNNNDVNRPVGGATEDFPPILMRRYELRILPLGRRGTLPPFTRQHHHRVLHNNNNNNNKAAANGAAAITGLAMRHVMSHSMGKLVTITGMIVRASDVKPSCVVATYSCDVCGVEVYQPIAGRREFLPQRTCPSRACRNRGGGGGNRGGGGNGNGGGTSKTDSLHLQTRGSKFAKFQELKLQELPSQVPMGHVPRSMSVYCRGELTRLVAPGEICTIDGVFLPQRLAESGFKAMKAGLISTTFLEAQNIVVHKKSYDESLADGLSEDEAAKLAAQIHNVATGEDPIGRLSSSIAPEIFGHEDIKRSLLLQLVGGCTRTLPDGMRIRGDINILVMGDPGTAKSQLLKHVASIAPRGVYTTGKGSSGVGLTAAVTKDMATGEMALEGGALVLADEGIACIDEFDKMQESDRTALHEVAEQQTVSIAKAGIVATLNARAAILAAANPLYSRYNRSKSLSENINLPNSLLSRFDLLFLVLDVADVDRDMALARHVTLVHQNEGLAKAESKEKEQGDDENDEQGIVPPPVLREYIARARKYYPVVSPEVAPYIVEAYVSLRMEDRPSSRGGARNKQNDQTVMTARQLLSILRLSQALARLRFSDFVAREDVDEAIRLTHMSKASILDNGGSDKGKRGRGEDVMSRIFNTLRDYACTLNADELELKLAEAMALRKGFTTQQLQSCLEEYEALQVIQVNQARTHVQFISGV